MNNSKNVKMHSYVLSFVLLNDLHKSQCRVDTNFTDKCYYSEDKCLKNLQ